MKKIVDYLKIGIFIPSELSHKEPLQFKIYRKPVINALFVNTCFLNTYPTGPSVRCGPNGFYSTYIFRAM